MNIALVLAGGKGNRINVECPKQYIKTNGKPLFAYCIDTLTDHSEIDVLWIVADDDWHEYILEHMSTDKFCGFSLPGENRQLSIWNAMQDLGSIVDKDSFVLIHDAARPLLTKKQISDCLDAASNHEGVMPVLAMKDTIYLSQDGILVTSLLNRSQIFAGQSPEVFRFRRYFEANKRLSVEQMLQINGSTEPAIMLGMDITMIPGDEMNFKITTKEDLERFQRIMSDHTDYGKDAK